jgi:hypothetical protein
MHSQEPLPSIFVCLFPHLEDLSQEDVLCEVQYLRGAGGSGERCLAQAALDLTARDGLFADLVWSLDEANFNRLMAVLLSLRRR